MRGLQHIWLCQLGLDARIAAHERPLATVALGSTRMIKVTAGFANSGSMGPGLCLTKWPRAAGCTEPSVHEIRVPFY